MILATVKNCLPPVQELLTQSEVDDLGVFEWIKQFYDSSYGRRILVGQGRSHQNEVEEGKIIVVWGDTGN